MVELLAKEDGYELDEVCYMLGKMPSKVHALRNSYPFEYIFEDKPEYWVSFTPGSLNRLTKFCIDLSTKGYSEGQAKEVLKCMKLS